MIGSLTDGCDDDDVISEERGKQPQPQITSTHTHTHSHGGGAGNRTYNPQITVDSTGKSVVTKLETQWINTTSIIIITNKSIL